MKNMKNFVDFNKVNESKRDLKISQTDFEKIKAYKGGANPKATELKGDLDQAIELINNIEDRTEAIMLYKDIIYTYPEWSVTQDTIESRDSNSESAKKIQLANIMSHKLHSDDSKMGIQGELF